MVNSVQMWFTICETVDPDRADGRGGIYFGDVFAYTTNSGRSKFVEYGGVARYMKNFIIAIPAAPNDVKINTRSTIDLRSQDLTRIGLCD